MCSWMVALNDYSYPVKLSDYEHGNRFPNYFQRYIVGDRNSTIDFEDYFRENSPKSIEAYFEVVFWKLYSQERDRNRITTGIVNYVLRERINSGSLYNTIDRFVKAPNKQNLQKIRNLLGIRTPVLAVPLTFPAFFNPKEYPMVDKNVARWVNKNFIRHSRNKRARLTQFVLGYTSLRDNDFPNYLNWVGWCSEMAVILTDKTSIEWRARDVEMAVFTAERNKLPLNVL